MFININDDVIGSTPGTSIGTTPVTPTKTKKKF